MTAGRHLLLRVGSMLAVTSGATAIAARTDEPTLAAHQIGAGLLLFLALGLDALAIPAQTLVAEELGQGAAASAAEISRRCVRLSLIVGAVLTVVLAALAPVLPHAFTDDPAVISRTTAVVLWLAAMLVPAAVAFAYDGVLIGAADYRFLGLAALSLSRGRGAARCADRGHRRRDRRDLGQSGSVDGDACDVQPPPGDARHAARPGGGGGLT